jgi:cell division transport system permease protein
MFISFYRAAKFSFQDIIRNVWLSVVTIIILMLALFSVNLLLVAQVIGRAAVDTVRDKIDVSLYLKSDSAESDILALRAQISGLDNVREVSYISKQQALDDFQTKYKNNPDIIDALRELDSNPLSPSLIILPQDVNRYDSLIANLNKISNPIIESRNFDDHKLMLEKINAITERVSQAGFIMSLLFIFITLLVLYNTVRVAIYTHRAEIGIMRLVGGSNWFIRSPFMISSIIYTLIGLILTTVAFYIFLSLLQPYLETFFMNYDFNIINYFKQNFIQFFVLEFIGTAIINMLASLVAVRKYSNV